jgi:tRNA-2-methylthio-N6-dimethylallyladenosine synthase
LSKGFFITTMGCQMNTYDSDFLAQSLIKAGFSQKDAPEDADLILVNTCTVRAKPQQKAFSLIGRLSALKQRHPERILGILGCVAQQQGAGLLDRFPALDMVIGPRELGRFQEILQAVLSRRERVAATGLDGHLPPPISCPGYFSGRVTGYVSIMEGCNNFCTYCVVPYVRGREVSRSPGEIVSEAELLAKEGIKEITLLGQNVNSYARGERGGWRFPDLLRRLSELEGILRWRFTTSHPKDLSDELIACFRDLPRLCSHIHLPFQAGSNKVLQRMGRGYTRERYLELVTRLRNERPDMAMSSDVMVGFPGESEKDFQQTMDLVNQVQFDALFSFKYSDRGNTPAEKMDRKVGEEEKTRRLSALQTLQQQITLKRNRDLVGRDLAVLVEGKGKREMQLTGRTESNKIVNFKADEPLLGRLVQVTITEGLLNSLRGRLMSGE